MRLTRLAVLNLPVPQSDTAAAHFTLTSRLQAALELLRDLLPGHVVDELLNDTQSQQQQQQQQLDDEQLGEQLQESGELEQEQAEHQREQERNRSQASTVHGGSQPYSVDSPFSAGFNIPAGLGRAVRQLSCSSHSASHTSYTPHAMIRTHSESMGVEALHLLGGCSRSAGSSVPWASSPGGMFDEWLAGSVSGLGAITGPDGTPLCCMAGATWPCAQCRRALDLAAHHSTPLLGPGSTLLAAAHSVALSAPAHPDQGRPTTSSYESGSYGTTCSHPGTRTGFLIAERDCGARGNSGSGSGSGSGTGFDVASAGSSMPASAHLLRSMYPANGAQDGSQLLGNGTASLDPLGPQRLAPTVGEGEQQLLEGTEDEEAEARVEAEEAADDEEEEAKNQEDGGRTMDLAPFLGLTNQSGSDNAAFDEACRLLLAPIRCSPRAAGQEPGQQQTQPRSDPEDERGMLGCSPTQTKRRDVAKGMWAGVLDERSARPAPPMPPSPPLQHPIPAPSRQVTGDGRAGEFASGASGVSGRSFMPTLNGMIVEAAAARAGAGAGRAQKERAERDNAGSGGHDSGGSRGARPVGAAPDSPHWELPNVSSTGIAADAAEGVGLDTMDDAFGGVGMDTVDENLRDIVTAFAATLSTGLRRVKTAVVDLFSLAGFAGGSSSGAAPGADATPCGGGGGLTFPHTTDHAGESLRDTRSMPTPLQMTGVRGSRSSNQLPLFGMQAVDAQVEAMRGGNSYGGSHGANDADGTVRSSSGWLYGTPPGQSSSVAAAAMRRRVPCHSSEVLPAGGRPRHPRPSLSMPLPRIGAAAAAASGPPLSPPSGGSTWAWWAQQPASSRPSAAGAAGWRSPPPPGGLMRSLVPAFARRSMSLTALNAVDGVADPPEAQLPSALLRQNLAAGHGGTAAAGGRGGAYGSWTTAPDFAVGGSRPRPIVVQRLPGLGGGEEGFFVDSPPAPARLRRLPRASTSALYGSGAPNSSCSEAGTPRALGNGGGAAPYTSGSGFGSGLHDLPYAEWHPCVSVLFADICGFTQISNRVPAVAVMEMLNALYCRLDVLCASWGQQQQQHPCGSPPAASPSACAPVYKVQIIGDAYMVATGLLADHPAHAATACSFALAILREAEQVVDPCDGKPLRLRVGIHSGPVVSGVVGRMRRQYSVFGDTVNVASRMESTGAPGAIHVSEDTQRLAAPYMPAGDYVWRRREGVEVKGKGIMDTYWLEEGTGTQQQA
ncbi:Soluble guanylate cyclase 88E [Tetrabaena socialis]|uniref:Soluble guanylate cyclase 88E n=1 Tax=Tetrabaena socialis TaxID=47790 RepID=A0A2J8ACF5_9CHLO|nr:Soluble guanylate cyclase 88E [Tetrabaena socialis]|eukprot:PNH10202.1 Soluble guanylate cyclase 88E [Tetrabaena socialis]